MGKGIFGCLFIVSLFSCNFLESKSDIFLAEVYGKELYYEDIRHLVTIGLNEEDSTKLVQSILEKWVKEQLLLQKAKLNLPLIQQEVSAQVESYENSLLIYAYQRELLNQKLDSVVSDKEIKDFYDNNQRNFLLDKDIATVNYIKLKKEVPYLWKVKSLYKKNDEDSRVSLEDYCHQFAQEYYIDDDWQYINDIFLRLPEDLDLEYINFYAGKSLEFDDDQFNYYIFLKKYKSKGNVSPLNMIKNKIRTIVLNKRKLEFLKDVEKELYQTALYNNHIRYEEN
ncbi:MAG: hypothetical protein ACON5E_01285 [Flavobacteriales bacterium]